MKGIKEEDNCWNCKHLTSRVASAPPLFCKAFPKGGGVPLAIVSGDVKHDRLLGGEAVDVFFERKG